MPHDACTLCGAEPHRYVSACDGCQARLYARVRGADARGVLVEHLRRIERERGRETAERVREQAIRQRGTR